MLHDTSRDRNAARRFLDAVGPYPHGDDKFAVRFAYGIIQRQSRQRTQFDEIAVFTVAKDRIVKEAFFYDTG